MRSRGRGVCAVRFGQYSASMGPTVTRSFRAWASCRSSVTNASAWSWVRAACSASKVSAQPSRPAVAPGEEWPGRSLVSGLPRPDLHRIKVTALAEAAIAVLPPGVLGGQAFVMAVPGIWE